MRSYLKSCRQKLGLDVASVANELGISASHYYKIEAGIRNPNMELAKRISVLYGDTVDKLFFSQNVDETSRAQSRYRRTV